MTDQKQAKKVISTLPDCIYLLFLVHVHSNLIVNSAVHSNSPLKHPSANLFPRKLRYLTDCALNYADMLHFEWFYLIWVRLSFLFSVVTSISSPYFSQLLLFSLYSSALQTSEQMHNTDCDTNPISKSIDWFCRCSNTKNWQHLPQ